MKMRLTISDEAGAELVSQVFEIGGRNDYQQAASNMWDQLREKLTEKGMIHFGIAPSNPIRRHSVTRGSMQAQDDRQGAEDQGGNDHGGKKENRNGLEVHERASAVARASHVRPFRTRT